jgi:2-polyprenyl-3-methyl-5-hydroxy-6-metoxy-1,4-benzoquinol methylase
MWTDLEEDIMLLEPKVQRPCNLCKSFSSEIVFTKNGFNLTKCLTCGLVYVENFVSESELKKLYSFESGYHTAFLDEHSPQFKHHLKQGYKYHKMIKDYKKQGRILDIGCSAGFFLKAAKEDGWEAYGLELSDDTAEIARRSFGLNILNGCLIETTYESNFFDVVTLWDTIEHIEDPLKTMLIINKILKENGIVAISTPNIDGLFPKLSYKIGKFIKYWPHPEPPAHLFQFSEKTLSKLLNQAGFEVLKTTHSRIPIQYTFGSVKSLLRSPKALLYAAVFIPTVLLGPLVHSGDSMFVFAVMKKKVS